MIKKDDLLEAIAECQGTRSPNANTAIKLAAFYTILDHLEEKSDNKTENNILEQSATNRSFAGYSMADSPVVRYDGTSKFAQVIDGRAQSEVWPVIDELMSTVKILNEKLYNGVMRKLQ